MAIASVLASPAAAAISTATSVAPLSATTTSDLGYDRYLVTGIDSAGDVDDVASTGASIDSVEPDRLRVTATPSEAAAIAALGFTLELIPPVTGSAAPADNIPTPHNDYHTYSEMVSDINAVAAQYPSLVKVSVFGSSFEGRSLYAIKISDNVTVDESEPEVLYDAGIHAREHITVEMALYLLHMFTEQYTTDARVRTVVDSREIWILPNMNPDGKEFDASTGLPLFWRKNRQPTPGSTAIGTDVNRNFSYQWNCCPEAVSSNEPTSSVYRGPFAASTPEAQALQSFIQSRRIGGVQQIKAAIDFHSYAELVLWPYGYTKSDTAPGLSADQQATFRAIGEQMAATNGYTAIQSSDLYVSDGTSTDYMWAVEGIWAYALEMYPKLGDPAEFYPSDQVIPAETARNREAALLLAEYADCPYRAIGKADQYCVTLTTVPNVISWNLTSARNAIQAAGLVVGSIGWDTRCIDVANTVLSQNPSPGTVRPVGTTVNLVVSTGKTSTGKTCIFL